MSTVKKNFCKTQITTFGTEALFIPHNHMHSMSNEFGLSREIFDLDEIRDRSKSFGKPFIPLGTIFGGIESTTDQT